MAKYGIDPVKDFIPYITAFFAWLGSFNWILIISVIVAVFRAYIAWKEYKLKERIEDAKSRNVQTKAPPNTNKEETEE